MLHMRFAHSLQTKLFDQERNSSESRPHIGGKLDYFRVHGAVQRLNDPGHSRNPYSIKVIETPARKDDWRSLIAEQVLMKSDEPHHSDTPRTLNSRFATLYSEPGTALPARLSVDFVVLRAQSHGASFIVRTNQEETRATIGDHRTRHRRVAAYVLCARRLGPLHRGP